MTTNLIALMCDDDAAAAFVDDELNGGGSVKAISNSSLDSPSTTLAAAHGRSTRCW